MSRYKNKRVGVRIRTEDAANIETLITSAGPFADLAGISDVIRLSLKLAAAHVRGTLGAR
jgi:hypothetical protein